MPRALGTLSRSVVPTGRVAFLGVRAPVSETDIKDNLRNVCCYTGLGGGSNTVGNSAGRRRKGLLLFFCYSCYLFKKNGRKDRRKTAPLYTGPPPPLARASEKKTQEKERNMTQKLSKNVISGCTGPRSECTGSGPKGRSLSGSGLWSRFP